MWEAEWNQSQPNGWCQRGWKETKQSLSDNSYPKGKHCSATGALALQMDEFKIKILTGGAASQATWVQILDIAQLSGSQFLHISKIKIRLEYNMWDYSGN